MIYVEGARVACRYDKITDVCVSVTEGVFDVHASILNIPIVININLVIGTRSDYD